MPIASDTCQQCGTVAGSEALHCDQNAPKLVATRPLSSQPFVVDMCIGPGDRYKIIKQLGAGGFGQAYLAEDTTLNRRCVVKQLRINSDWSLQDREFYEKRFQHEAQLIATANQYGHPHILDIYDYLAEIQCLVLQYVTERRLTDVYLSQDSLPEMEALSYIRDICSALIYLHSQAPAPILHLDVKPENILCDEEGRVWLIDFGSADRSGGEQTQSTTPLLVSVSKPYTPPEQERGAPEPRSDIYALARTLQVLLVGRVSNAGTSWNDALPTAGRVTSHQVRRVPDPSDPDATVIREASISELMPIVIPAMRPDIAALIRDGVAANVEDRPTAREFFARLEAIIDSLHVPSPPPPAVPPEPRPLVGRDTALLQVRLDVEKGRLRFFAKATGQTDPVYSDEVAARAAGHPGLPVPPTFLFCLEMESPDPAAIRNLLGLDYKRLLHGEQGFSYHRMAYAGDRLRFEQRIEDIYDKKGGALEFVLRRTRVTNQRGEHVADLRSVTVMRNG